jgi:hypothetical protein
MEARFIPTVERESIDFADRYVGKWNKELLVMGGLLCRVEYDDEMDEDVDGLTLSMDVSCRRLATIKGILENLLLKTETDRISNADSIAKDIDSSRKSSRFLCSCTTVSSLHTDYSEPPVP